MKKIIKWTASTKDRKLIARIVQRSVNLGITPANWGVVSLSMDITACHLNGCPLKLAELLAADNFNFTQDIVGIQRHIDRDDSSPTCGQLLDCFRPRFAA